jgi:hypothetical protein
MNPTLKINGSDVEVIVEHGAILDVKCSSRKDYSEQWSMLANANILHSELKEETQLFYKSEDGQERHLSLPSSIPALPGHKVKVLYAKSQKDGLFRAIAVHNVNLGRTYVEPLKSTLISIGIELKVGSATGYAGLWIIGIAVALGAVLPKFPDKVPGLWLLAGIGLALLVIDLYILAPASFLKKHQRMETELHLDAKRLLES